MADDDKEAKGMAAAPESAARPSRALRIALALSLAFNVLIVGLIAGGIASGRHMAGPRGFNADLGPFARALSIDERRGLSRELRERPEIGQAGAQDMGRIQRAFIEALVADPFDPAAIERMFAAERLRGTQAMQIGQDMLLRRIAAMTPQQRQQFARRLSREWNGREDD